MTVIISPNIKKERTFINGNGDEVKPYTKEVIKSVNADVYIPTQEERLSAEKRTIEYKEPVKEVSPLSIQEQIDQAKENLAKLEELKKLKIAEMKAQLELLENE